MDTLESLLTPIRHSPRLLEAVGLLQEQIEEEKERRSQFYQEMTPEQKIEFVDGEVILHSPARRSHLDATGNLFHLISTFVKIQSLGSVFSEKCLCCFPRNDYEPDIVFFGPEKSKGLDPDTMKFPIPDFAIEVLSTSTEKNDRGVKFEDFAANGVREYWLVDPDQQFVEQYLLREGEYDLHFKGSSGDLRCEVIKGLILPVAAIFDEATNLETLRQIVGR